MEGEKCILRISGKSKNHRMVILLVTLQAVAVIVFFSCNRKAFAISIRNSMLLKLYNSGVELCTPQLVFAEDQRGCVPCRDIIAAVVPAFSYHSQILWYDAQMEGRTDYELLAAQENAQYEAMLAENAQVSSDEDIIDAQREDKKEEAIPEEETKVPTIDLFAQPPQKQVEIKRKKLNDFDYLRQNFYQIDSTTTTNSKQLSAKKFLKKDMTLKATEKDAPQILIYHTHSQEGYKDSKPGDSSTTVVGVGEYLTQLLTTHYGYKVLHHTGEYDVGDRDHAYSNAAPALEKILKDNPSIQVVIDLHRDGVAEKTHLVTKINGKNTAQIMFFNGLCRTTTLGDISWLPNPYIQENLAFSFQMQLAAAEYYPDLTRCIYLKGYRYNMHYCPQSLLIEVGAQTNTVEEAMNAMEPLAVVMHEVLGDGK